MALLRNCDVLIFLLFCLLNIFPSNFTVLLLCVQAPEPYEHFNGQDSQTAAHTQSDSRSGSHSTATQYGSYGNPSTSSFSTQPVQTQDLPQPLPQVHAQSSDGSVPPGLASTLEHIISQLDILTKVSRICVYRS